MTDSTPLARLRALHEPILCPDCGSDEHCGYCGNETWPCDTIAALDALEARLDAATVLIRNMIAQDDRVHEVWDGLDEGPCPETAPFRAWLASAKGEGQ